VLAVHGWFGSARGWGSLPDFLDRSTYTYAFMDLRGYGGRQEVAGEFTMEEAAADAIALAGELGWDRFSVIGHSMGAKVAHQMLLQAPDRLDKLVGLNPVPPGAVPMDEQSWELFSGAAANAGNRAAIINFTTGSKLTATFINHVVRHSLENSNQAAFAAYLQAWAKTDFSGKVQPDTSTPVKVIVGVNDPALSADVMEKTWLVCFPEAEMTILPDAGHYPMFESPVSLATSIEEFLGRD
jgi:pimeloyl-ACP methyl ester carboxylesterase